LTRSVPAQPLLDQLAAAVDEGAHDEVADLGVGLHQGQHLLARQLDGVAGLDDADAGHRRAAEQRVGLAGERPRPVLHDQLLALWGEAQHVDAAAAQHEERHGRGAWLDQRVALTEGSHAAVRRDAADLRRRQLGEHQHRMTGVDDDRGTRIRHRDSVPPDGAFILGSCSPSATSSRRARCRLSPSS
jgi:hypothetical protein